MEERKRARGSTRGIRVFLRILVCGACLQAPVFPARGAAAETSLPQTLSPEEGAKEGAALVANLLSEKPEVNLTNRVVLRITNASRKTREVGARFTVLAGQDRTTNIYETLPGGAPPGSNSMKFVVIRAPGEANQYLLSQPAGSEPRKISGNETMVPFAGSDFWAVDLGLEFLQWPVQVITRKEMKRGQVCAVLESANPNRTPGAYSRVLSWVAINRPGVATVQAEAYDNKDKLLKEFLPKKIEKVNGQWQLDEMDISNLQIRSRSKIDLNPGK